MGMVACLPALLALVDKRRLPSWLADAADDRPTTRLELSTMVLALQLLPTTTGTATIGTTTSTCTTSYVAPGMRAAATVSFLRMRCSLVQRLAALLLAIGAHEPGICGGRDCLVSAGCSG